MSLKTTIEDQIKQALKGGEQLKLAVLRMLLSAVRNREFEKRAKLARGGISDDSGIESLLTDDEVMDAIRSEVKKRKDSIEGFEKGGRKDLAEKESQELLMLQAYLPAEISDEEIMNAVREITNGFPGASVKDYGKVMAEAMKTLKGRASGDRVAAAVKQALSAV